ncbi:MAG: ribosomal-processing cysteine protease Prp [Clostridiales bacterium]|jgi:uncharacterized protein YsxB (DUF464 family)|nr:ribosomal-processing cysteine protease Prp [Clostridiales bacterium]
MINAEIISNEAGCVVGFTVKNHGESKVCAAVSLLTINTVNSIEKLTEDDFFCSLSEKNAFISFTLKNTDSRSPEIAVLLDALVMGLKSVEEKHPTEISIIE